jgi:putative hemolysin
MKKLLTLMVFGLILTGCTLQNNKTPQPENKITQPITEATTCKEQGGTWIVGSSEFGAKCILPYADAGKKCTSSNQCEGDCVTNVISQLGKEGICQKNDGTQGCFNPIESDRFKCLFDDIMMICDNKNWDALCDTYKGKSFFQ